MAISKKNMSDTISDVINKYLKDHSDLRKLFNENSIVDNTKFFFKNWEDIFMYMGCIFQDNYPYSYSPDNFAKKYAEDYSQFISTMEKELSDAKEKWGKENKEPLKISQRRMIIAALIYQLVSHDFTIEDLPIDKSDLERNDGTMWYRGQSDYHWQLTPSMFRNLQNVYPSPTEINIDKIAQLYQENGMIEKWHNIFRTDNVDYKFLAYMQHSISYSPFLDFTSDFPTALSFALANKSSLNDFLHKDSSIFEIKINSDEVLKKEDDKLPPNFSITFFPEPYSIGTPILGRPMNTYDDIITALKPDCLMIDIETNDRMKYQKGKFLFFYNYLSLQGTVCTWLNEKLKVTKYKIQKEEKNRWCRLLHEKYPYLLVDKMMNPYDYFSEQ